MTRAHRLVAVAAAGASLLAAAPADARTLERGMRGDDVRALQRLLRALEQPVSLDAAFGPGTERAVRRYERREGLAVDGRVSRGQMRGMRRRAGLPARISTTRFAVRALARGARGSDVRALQRLLTIVGVRTRDDAVFGARTERAVRRYERREDLHVDGRMSPGQQRGLARRAGVEVPAPAPPLAQTLPAATGSFAFPIAGDWRWGERGAHFGDRNGKHRGEDLFAECGTPLVAVTAGQVRHVGYQRAAGHYVVLAAADGESYAYMHLRAKPRLTEGQAVSPGQPVGQVGATGNASACHLHFELWTPPGWYAGGKPVDPVERLREWSRAAPAATAAGSR